MAAPYDDDVYDDDELDAEGPQEADLTPDDAETDVVNCPNCGRAVAEFAERCPHCGDWIVAGGGVTRGKPWIVVAALAALAGFVVWVLARVL